MKFSSRQQFLPGDSIPGASKGNDCSLGEVIAFFAAIPDFQSRTGKLIRRAFDEVIDGGRTGRYKVAELEKTEKTYIGTKVEILFHSEYRLEKGAKLDYLVCGHEVDMKFSLRGSWMIPREAVNEICILTAGDDEGALYSLGIKRVCKEDLGLGENQDGKRTISRNSKVDIHWLAKDDSMPGNLLAKLPTDLREQIFAQPVGQPRVNQLYRSVQGVPIPRSVVEALAQQKDPMKRMRDARKRLGAEGIQVLCARYASDKELAKKRGYTFEETDETISFQME